MISLQVYIKLYVNNSQYLNVPIKLKGLNSLRDGEESPSKALQMHQIKGRKNLMQYVKHSDKQRDYKIGSVNI